MRKPWPSWDNVIALIVCRRGNRHHRLLFHLSDISLPSDAHPATNRWTVLYENNILFPPPRPLGPVSAPLDCSQATFPWASVGTGVSAASVCSLQSGSVAEHVDTLPKALPTSGEKRNAAQHVWRGRERVLTVSPAAAMWAHMYTSSAKRSLRSFIQSPQRICRVEYIFPHEN